MPPRTTDAAILAVARGGVDLGQCACQPQIIRGSIPQSVIRPASGALSP